MTQIGLFWNINPNEMRVSNFQNVERRLFSVLLEKDKEKIFELEKSHD